MLRNRIVSAIMLVAFVIAGMGFYAVERIKAEKAVSRVSAEGHAEKVVKPDYAIISFGIVSTGADAEELKERHNAAVRKTAEAVGKSGALQESINITLTSVQPVLQLENSLPVVGEYRMQSNVTAAINDP